MYKGSPEARVRAKSGTVPAANVVSGHPRAPHRLASPPGEVRALLVGEVAVEVVVAELGVAPGGEVAGLDLLRCGVGQICLPGLQQSGDDVTVERTAL